MLPNWRSEGFLLCYPLELFIVLDFIFIFMIHSDLIIITLQGMFWDSSIIFWPIFPASFVENVLSLLTGLYSYVKKTSFDLKCIDIFLISLLYSINQCSSPFAINMPSYFCIFIRFKIITVRLQLRPSFCKLIWSFYLLYLSTDILKTVWWNLQKSLLEILFGTLITLNL